MSTASPTYRVGFKQLSTDAKRAGLEFAETEVPEVSAKELRHLLRAAADIAPQVAYPLAPELRVITASGRYVVQLKDGRLHFVTWSSAASRGGNPSADEIFAIISGEGQVEEFAPTATGGLAGGPKSSGSWRWIVGSIAVVTIIASNFYSVWNYRRPPGKLLPAYNLLDSGRDKNLLDTVAGQYETGGAPGDRRLEISRDGKVVWIKFGLNRHAVEKREFTAKGASSEGQPALFTSRNSLIKVKDAASLVLFGDTYQRVAR